MTRESIVRNILNCDRCWLGKWDMLLSGYGIGDAHLRSERGDDLKYENMDIQQLLINRFAGWFAQNIEINVSETIPTNHSVVSETLQLIGFNIEQIEWNPFHNDDQLDMLRVKLVSVHNPNVTATILQYTEDPNIGSRVTQVSIYYGDRIYDVGFYEVVT